MTEADVPADVQMGDVAAVRGVVGSVGGEGNMINPTFHFNDVGGLQQVRDYVVPTRSRWDRTRLLTPDPRYVPPSELPALVNHLLNDRAVLLSGGPETGMSSAASYLIRELARRLANDGVELVAEEILTDKDLRLTEQLDRDNLALLLDLSYGEPDALNELDRDLGRFLPTLDQGRGYLVVLLPSEQHDRFAARFPGRVHHAPEPPDPLEVFERHLHDTVAEPLVKSCLDTLWVREQLTDAQPPHAAHIAALVLKAHQAGRHDAQSAVDYARHLHEDLTSDLRRSFARHTGGEWRSLLIAAAALENAPPTAIVSAATLLRDCAAHEPVPAPVLERPGVVTLLSQLADEQFDPKTTRFRRARFALSVLEYVWAEHPDLRQALVAWLGRLPADVLPSVNRRAVEQFTDRVVDLSSRHGAGIVLSVTDRWSGSAALSRSMAVRALGRAAVDPRIGWPVRQRLYHWSHQAGAVPRKRVVVEVCGGALGQKYPKVALVRLKHLAADPDPDLAESVTTAVSRIAKEHGTPELLRLLEASWSDHMVNLVAALRATILRTDHNTWLAARRERDKRSVVKFWRQALYTLATSQISELVWAWLDRATTTADEYRTVLLETLITAARGDPRRFAALTYVAVRWPTPDSWASDPTGVRIEAVRAHLRTRLDEIDPLLSEPTMELTDDDH